MAIRMACRTTEVCGNTSLWGCDTEAETRKNRRHWVVHIPPHIENRGYSCIFHIYIWVSKLLVVRLKLMFLRIQWICKILYHNIHIYIYYIYNISITYIIWYAYHITGLQDSHSRPSHDFWPPSLGRDKAARGLTWLWAVGYGGWLWRGYSYMDYGPCIDGLPNWHMFFLDGGD